MNEPIDPIRFIVLDEFNFSRFRSQLLHLYLHAFTTGEQAQYIDPQEAERILDGMVQHGTGLIAFEGERLAGMVMGLPLRYDKDFSADSLSEIEVDGAFYIAELMVHADLRGRGIAKALLAKMLSLVKKSHTDVVIRVWDENKPALSLYKKLGFHPVATISQTKKHLSGELFEMRKIYLHINIF